MRANRDSKTGFVSGFFVLGQKKIDTKSILQTSATVQLHITVADLAKIGFTLLLRRPLGPHGGSI